MILYLQEVYESNLNYLLYNGFGEFMEKQLIQNSNLRLIVFESAFDFGKKIDECLVKMYGLNPSAYTFIIPIKENFFNDGHLKVEINDTVRGKDVYYITDIGNYSLEYNMRGIINHTSPNDLMMELKDGIGACNRHANSLNIVMPLLYAGRQHRRNTRENLMCGLNLHELDQMKGMRHFITFDAHDQSVEHSTFNMEFDNFFVTNSILTEMINNMTKEELENMVFIAPDNGATGRRNVYLNSFNVPFIYREAGSFIKQRDYNNLVNGKYPVLYHDYCGNPNLVDFTAIISDDMIASGGSLFDVIDELDNLGVKNIYVAVTYALFTTGIDNFRKYYEDGKLKGVYCSNLSYIPIDYKNEEWLHVCDCSEYVADIIYKLANNLSISEIMTDKSGPIKLLEKKFKNKP